MKVLSVISGAIISAVVALGTAIFYLGGMEQRVVDLTTKVENIPKTVRVEFNSWANSAPPHSEGIEIKFEQVKDWGKWGEPRFCPHRHYVCGMRQALEPHQGTGAKDDDTALNAVAMICCRVLPSEE